MFKCIYCLEEQEDLIETEGDFLDTASLTLDNLPICRHCGEHGLVTQDQAYEALGRSIETGAMVIDQVEIVDDEMHLTYHAVVLSHSSDEEDDLCPES